MAMSAKHIIKRTLLLLSIPAIIGTWFAANYLGKNNPLQAVKIAIQQNKDGQFISEKSIFTDLITNKNIVVKATSIKDVNVKEIEAVAKNNPWVNTAEAYISNGGILHINLTQKEPVLRLITEKGSHYYLDSNATIIPLNSEFSMDVPVLSVADLGMSMQDQNLKKQAVVLCNFINKDSFWNAMISQISITEQHDFELTTSIAEHTILIGDTSNLADKFNRVLLFYKQAVPKVGYDAYAVLNVKNVGQLVGIKNDANAEVKTENAAIKTVVKKSNIASNLNIVKNAVIKKAVTPKVNTIKKISTTKSSNKLTIKNSTLNSTVKKVVTKQTPKASTPKPKTPKPKTVKPKSQQ